MKKEKYVSNIDERAVCTVVFTYDLTLNVTYEYSRFEFVVLHWCNNDMFLSRFRIEISASVCFFLYFFINCHGPRIRCHDNNENFFLSFQTYLNNITVLDYPNGLQCRNIRCE